MDRLTALMQILKEEYGITNEAELDDAISKLPPLDIGIVTKLGKSTMEVTV